jgi:hypothetical protein
MPEHPGSAFFLAWTVQDDSPMSQYEVKKLPTGQGCSANGATIALPGEQK